MISVSAKKTKKRDGGHWGCSQCGHSDAQASQGELETLKWSVLSVLELRYLSLSCSVVFIRAESNRF